MDLREELTWIEISKENVCHNVNVLSRQAGGVNKLCAVVKGNAYGHGIETMTPLLYNAGIKKFAVYHADEAFRVREVLGDDVLIVLLGFAAVSDIKLLAEMHIECLLLNKGRLNEIHQELASGLELSIHLKIDTGMNRFGLQPAQIPAFLAELKKYPSLKLTGAASHFANAWNLTDKTYTIRQNEKFEKALQGLTQVNGQLKYQHISNSAALLVHEDVDFTFARVGICLYGYFPGKEVKDTFKTKLDLKPVLAFKTKIVSIKQMEVGEHAGYDITFQAKRKTKIALAPVGYSDGFPFAHSDQGAFVLIHGYRVPLIGRVNMNALLLDVTDLEHVDLADTVTLIGKDGDEEITVWDWLEWGTPHLYEALTSLRNGLPRMAV